MRGRIIVRCFIKSINPETKNKSQGSDGLTAEFYKQFSNELASVLWMSVTTRESLAPWVLLLEQESALYFI